MEDEYQIDPKKIAKDVWKFFSNKKIQTTIVAILFLLTLFVGASIRLQPITTGNLIDSTTGDYTPLALDPYYFLRVSETMLKGDLPEVDSMRSPAIDVPWTKELLPLSTVLIYKTMKLFNSDVSLRFANVANPVIFFVLGIIVFFFLILLLTKDKWLALLSSGVLTVIPPYLYRTLAGFSDHESIGIFGVFLAILFFVYGLFYLDRKKSNPKRLGIVGFLAGFMTMFAVVSWGGGGKFLFMIFPLAFILKWLTTKEKINLNFISFYALWIIGVLISSLFFGYSVFGVITAYMLSLSGLLTLFSLGYALVDSFLESSNILNKNLKKYSQLLNVGIVCILGSIFYQFFVGDLFSMISNLFQSILYPFGTARVALTVAENKQPYLMELINQIGKTIFYTFLLGCFIVGGKIASGIKLKKLRPLFIFSFSLFIAGILFSRISESSIFNGENFISKTFFFVSFLIFILSSVYIYLKSDWEIKTKWIFIVSWTIPLIFSVRSAIRVFFAIVPLIAFMVPLTIFEVGKFTRKTKDDLMKMGGYILLLLLIIGLVYTSFGFYKLVNSQAENQIPSYNKDWQNAMNWVRDNTPLGSIFLHWWDYGYWVQTGGERPTVSDGGHSQEVFNGNHKIGRYVLTTPYPETAKSFMKTQNVSYLLIDPTDIGKYGAYSSIGDDKNSSDRASFLPTFPVDNTQTQETRNGTTKLYRGGVYLDSDIVYEQAGKKILLPQGKALIIGIVLEKIGTGYSQPTGIFLYNNNQYRFPLRYISSEGSLRDFMTGINSTVYVYPNAESGKFEMDGAVMYLSEKTKDSLVAKLYLMNDPLDEYPELKLVHSEGIYPFNFYYQGFRGPIKIWKVDLTQMDNILIHEEFYNSSGEYGGLDSLQFIK